MLTTEELDELRRRATVGLSVVCGTPHATEIAQTMARNILRLLDDLGVVREERDVARAFHDVAVAERNSAWAEIDRLRALSENLRDERDCARETLHEHGPWGGCECQECALGVTGQDPY